MFGASSWRARIDGRPRTGARALFCRAALAWVLLAVAPPVSLAAAPSAASAAMPPVSLAAAPATCALGTDFTNPAGVLVTGQGFQAQARFRIYIGPKLVATPLTNSRGRFAIRVPVRSATTGRQLLRVQGAGCALQVAFAPAQPASVTNPAPGASSTAPPATPSPPALTTPTPRLSAPHVSRSISLGLIGVIAVTAAAVFALAQRAGHRRG